MYMCIYIEAGRLARDGPAGVQRGPCHPFPKVNHRPLEVNFPPLRPRVCTYIRVAVLGIYVYKYVYICIYVFVQT